jgi:hypothetical protein
MSCMSGRRDGERASPLGLRIGDLGRGCYPTIPQRSLFDAVTIDPVSTESGAVQCNIFDHVFLVVGVGAVDEYRVDVDACSTIKRRACASSPGTAVRYDCPSHSRGNQIC